MDDEAAKLGIDNITKVVSIIAVLANVGDQFGRDSGVTRWSHLVLLGPAIMTLQGINFSQVLPEIKDLDADERSKLTALFDSSLQLGNEHLEGVVEKGLGIVTDLVSIIERTKALVADAKAL